MNQKHQNYINQKKLSESLLDGLFPLRPKSDFNMYNIPL